MLNESVELAIPRRLS